MVFFVERLDFFDAMRYRICMSVKDIIITVKRVDVEEILSSLLLTLLPSFIFLSSGVYYFFVGKDYHHIEDIFFSPHLISIQFLLTLLSLFSLWILKNKPLSYTKPFNFFLFLNILIANLNIFISVLFIIFGMLLFL